MRATSAAAGLAPLASFATFGCGGSNAVAGSQSALSLAPDGEREVRGRVATYRNPLVAADCADPAVIAVDDLFYMTSSSSFDGGHMPLRRSRDLQHWEQVGFVLPSEGPIPEWAESDFWAPEIHRVGDRYLCYFTARDRGGRLCIGVLESDDVEGPWLDSAGRPLARSERVGAIDPHYFRDEDGRQYLLWKIDGNDLRPMEPTPILAAELELDGMTIASPPTPLIGNDLGWEAHVVEGPWLVRRGDWYYLFYAGNAYHTDAYATGVARARSPLGPFEKRAMPILASNGAWKGPGHGCVVSRGEQDYFVFHAWQAGRIGPPHPRNALIAAIDWSARDGWPRIEVTS